jgi:hypothetical protein
VYFLPVIPDSATVDVFAFGAGFPTARLGQDVGFGALAPALQVAPSEFGYALVVTRPSTDAHPEFPLAVASTGALVAGERYLAVAAGFAERGRAPVRITVVHDGFDRTTVTAARFRAIAAAADAPSVDFGQFPPGTDTAFVAFDGLGDLSYRASSAEPGVQVSAAPLNPGVQVTGTSVALHFRSGALIATDRAFGIFAGAFAPMAADTSSRFVIVKTPASGVWTAVALVPQP